MPVRVTAYLPEGAAERTALTDIGMHLVGRGEDCAVRIPHPSVSRRHAELVLDETGWALRDLGSKNGSRVDGLPTDGQFRTGDGWARIGDVACEIAWVDLRHASRWRDDAERRRVAATALTQALAAEPQRPELLSATLDAIIDLAGADRGLLLIPEAAGWRPAARRGFKAEDYGHSRFAGSRTAIERAIHTRRPVVIHDLSLDAELARRQSVLSGGLRALASIPLVMGDAVLGIAYADSHAPGATITRLDLELLEAFAERAALWLAARRNQAALDPSAARGSER